MQITSCWNVAINASYHIQENWTFNWIIRTVKKKWADVSISLPQLRTGLSESWKLCLNLWAKKWLKSSLNLVDNLTLGLWQLKTVLPEGRMKFKSVFLKIFKLFELRILLPSLFYLINAEEKRIYTLLWIEEYYWRNIISISCVIFTHRSRNDPE